MGSRFKSGGLKVPDGWSVADPHCHTTASDGMFAPEQVVRAAAGLGLDLIAIADHDTMAACDEAVACGTEMGVEVIRGQEITTGWPGLVHLLGLFLERPIRAGSSLLATVEAVHEQGGLAIIPHPFMPTYFASCQPDQLVRLLESTPVDGIELIHTAPITRGRIARLAAFYSERQDRLGAAIGSSDSHFGAHDMGRAVTLFPGRTATEFRRAVEQGLTLPRRAGRSDVPLALAARQQVRSLVGLPLRRLRGAVGRG